MKTENLEVYIAKLERDNAILRRDKRIIENELKTLYVYMKTGDAFTNEQVSNVHSLLRLLKQR